MNVRIMEFNLIQKLKTKTMRNTMLSLSSKGIGMILFLACDILIARFLSINEYGEWSFFYSFISMAFWIVWFGINISTKVYVAQANNDKDEQVDYFVAGLKLRFIISLVFSIIILLFGGAIANGLGYPEKYPHLYALIMVGSLLVFFNSFSEFFKETSIGLSNFKNIFIITLLEFGGYFLFGVGLLFFTKDIISIELGYIASLIIVTIFGFVFLGREFFKRYVHLSNHKSKLKIRRIFRYAIPLIFISLGAMILVEMDTFMIGMFSTGNEVALYSIGKKLYSKATHVNLALSTATMTVFATLSKDNVLEYKKRFKSICIVNLVLTILISMVFVVFGPFMITVLYGQEYAEAGNVLWSLTFYYIFFSISLNYSAFLDFQERAKIRSFYYTVMIVLNLIFNLLLIPKFGAIGAAVGTSLSMVPYVIFLFLDTRRTFRIYEIGRGE